MSRALDLCHNESVREITKFCPICLPCKYNCECGQRQGRRRIKRHNKCFEKRNKNACSQRIETMAHPKLVRIEGMLMRHSSVLDPERLAKVCRYINELRQPQPQKAFFQNSSKKSKKRRRKKNKKNKKKNNQKMDILFDTIASVALKYLHSDENCVPNYAQLKVALKMFNMLNLNQCSSVNQLVRQELCAICQKLAVLSDLKLQPFKQKLYHEKIKRAGDYEDKHIVFKMFDYDVKSEMTPPCETIYEEEEEQLGPISLFETFAGEDEGAEEPTFALKDFEDENEDLMSRIEETKQEEEDIKFGDEESEFTPQIADFLEDGLQEGGLQDGGLQEDGLQDEEEMKLPDLIEEDILAIDDGLTGLEKGGEEAGEAGRIAGKSGDEDEEEEIYEGIEEDLIPPPIEFAAEEEISLMLGPQEEEVFIETEESIKTESGEGMLDYHLDNTSSYVDWCLYVAWLKELGINMENFANCLQKFRSAIAIDAERHKETLQHLLRSWSEYVKVSRNVDRQMVQYFKDKPMTWCTKCRDCSIDDYPADHFIPPQLLEAVRVTKLWRRTLEQLEEYCGVIGGAAEEAESDISTQTYEICDVASSSSSSFDVESVGKK